MRDGSSIEKYISKNFVRKIADSNIFFIIIGEESIKKIIME